MYLSFRGKLTKQLLKIFGADFPVNHSVYRYSKTALQQELKWIRVLGIWNQVMYRERMRVVTDVLRSLLFGNSHFGGNLGNIFPIFVIQLLCLPDCCHLILG